MPDNRVGHGPSSDAVRATRQCYPVRSPALTASYVLCPTDLAWAMDGSANLSCLQAERSDKVMFSGGFIRARLLVESALEKSDPAQDILTRSFHLIFLVVISAEGRNPVRWKPLPSWKIHHYTRDDSIEVEIWIGIAIGIPTFDPDPEVSPRNRHAGAWERAKRTSWQLMHAISHCFRLQ